LNGRGIEHYLQKNFPHIALAHKIRTENQIAEQKYQSLKLVLLKVKPTQVEKFGCWMLTFFIFG
jgi:hypothetical protein